MKKLASIVDEIVSTSKVEQEKIAQAELLASQTPPTITSDLGLSLMKTASLLKEAKNDVTYEDLQAFMESIHNA